MWFKIYNRTKYETTKTTEGIDISVSFRCKNCNKAKSQVIRALQNLWNKIDSIKISPENIEIIKNTHAK